MVLTVIEYGGKKHIIDCESFEFRTNQVTNWIRLVYSNGSKEEIHNVCTIKCDKGNINE